MITATLLALSLLSSPSDSIIRRGEAVPAGKATPLATVLASPTRYLESPVLIEGVIVKNCTSKGCWMQVAPAKDAPGVRVTFKDYKFFIPLNSAGKQFRAIGITTMKVHSAKDAQHLTDEGATLTRNADGTATEIGFEAAGVEIF